ncbi:AAA family ATPase [Porphyrobacter sp. YT40]|uniref:AAA family ATPase n=1 Tax=Porphyrobacter sp. YT40 TaxID=2547601 RepID=UPI001142FA40|nr:AAA family ATPase [Porphyrobacter sp. YT40]QDH33139.1 AAA family ATPase [Porphyrobacter sp. YT40]
MTKRGILLGKFMPPHAGHLALIRAARALVDELTVLVCWLPDDPIAGETRLAWMRELAPDCRVAGHGEVVPQAPEESPDFWPIWRGIVGAVHPEPIDYLFAGEDYGAELARQVGGLFVPLGGRVLGLSDDPVAGLSASAIRADPAAHWPYLPKPVQAHYRRTVCLHGAESTGKTTLAAALARETGALTVGEYGRSHCEAHRDPLTLDDLLLIGRAQTAMIAAAADWAGPLLIADTDALMTAAWTEMLLGTRPAELMAAPKADLYLLLEPDLPWVDDGTRFFSDPADRHRFARIVSQVLVDARVPFVRIAGQGNERLAAALGALNV